MRKILTFILILCTVALFAEMRGGAQYDPGAIRSDGTNASDTVTFNSLKAKTSDTVTFNSLKAKTSGGLTIKGSGDATAMTIGAGGGTAVSTADGLNVGGILKTADGSAAAPAFSFASDTNTGIHRSAENTLALTGGGVVGITTSGGSTAMGAAVDTGSRLRISGNATTHANTALVESPYRSLSVSGANYIDALKIGPQTDSIPVGEVDAGYRQGIYIGNLMYNTNFKGTLTNLFGLRVDTGISTGMGTLTNCYGAYISTASGAGTITNNWGLYQATAAARNYFAGRTLFGTTTDDGVSAVQVSGGGLRLVGAAAPATPAEGTLYFNSTDKHFYGWNGTAWVQLDN